MMRVTLVWLLAACVSPSPTSAPLPPRVATPVPVTGPPLPGGTCPEEMVPVPRDAPRFCIDAYEDQVVDGAAVSRAGVVPTVGVTYDEAAAACAATVVRDAAGLPVGHKRMPLASEWEDALDGTVGPGGQAFPYGSDARPGVCNVPDRDGAHARGHAGGGALLATGSKPGCVSPFGAFDLLGNAWEWTDSGQRLDIAAWLDARRAEGLRLEWGEDHRVRLKAGKIGALRLVLNAVRPDALHVAADGSLQLADGVGSAGMFPAGFLSAHPSGSPPYLPIVAAPIDPARPTGPWAIGVRLEDDGAPLPDKRGCAFYAGSADTCHGSVAALTHPHDFNGTIAARCVADPLGG